MIGIKSRFTLTREQDSGSICLLGEVTGDIEVAPVNFDRGAKETRLCANTERAMGVTRLGAYNHCECLKLHASYSTEPQEKVKPLISNGLLIGQREGH